MKFLHIADCHVGCRQYGMKERERDFYRALASAADVAVENNCDAVVVAGDLFDAVKPPAEAVCVVKDIVWQLNKNGIRVLGIEGNHDITGNNYWLRVCGIEPLDKSMIDVGGVSVAGFNYRRSDELINEMRDADENMWGSKGPDVIVLHAGFVELGDSFTGDLSVNSIMPYLVKWGVKYVALGHIHIPMEPVYDGVHFVQPGSTEMKDLSEPSPKVAVVATVSDDGVAQSQIPLVTRKVESVTISNEEKLHEFLESVDVRNAFDGSLVAVYVSNSIKDGVKRVEDMLKRHDVLFRLSVFDGGSSVSAGPSEYDRSTAMPTLASAIGAYFDEGSEQYALVSEILRTPENIRGIVEEYLNKRKSA